MKVDYITEEQVVEVVAERGRITKDDLVTVLNERYSENPDIIERIIEELVYIGMLNDEIDENGELIIQVVKSEVVE